MSIIAAQWTGNGVVDGTDVTAGNINTAGNSTGSGVTWARNVSGSPSYKYAGNGFEIISDTSSDIARLDATLGTGGTAVRTQVVLTVNATPTGTNLSFIVARNASTSASEFLLSTARQLVATAGGFFSNSTSPAVAIGDRLLIDYVVALHSSPTTSNGRIFYRIKNLTNTTWNTTGEFFADSGYTMNAGTANFTAVRFGKMAAAVSSPGLRLEYLGVERITVSTSDTSSVAARAYFADAPPEPATPLSTPTVTVTGTTDPTSSSATDGTITVTWPAVSNASYYVAEVAPGSNATADFSVASSNVTSPYTFTGLGGGDYTVAITAYPGV